MTRLQVLRRRLGLLDGKSARAAAVKAAPRSAETAYPDKPASSWGRMFHE